MVLGEAHIRSSTRQWNFDHLRILANNFPRNRTPRPLRQVVVKYKHPHNRIAAWNYEPGDKVYVRAGALKGMIAQVDSVARHSGQIYLGAGVKPALRSIATREKGASLVEGAKPQGITAPPSTHYSNVSLVLPEKGENGEDLVATRVRASRLRYSKRARSFIWRRTPEAVKRVVVSASVDGRRRLSPTPVPIPANSRAQKAAEERKDRDPSADYVVLWRSQSRRSQQDYPPLNNATAAEEVKKDSFLSTALLSNFTTAPELRIPSLEFSGGPNSRAQRTNRWNALNRGSDWRKIPKPTPMRRLAKVNWAAGLKKPELPLSSEAQKA